MGRTFFSPKGGIYLSMVIKPNINLEDSVNITTCAAVAVCKSIKKITGLDVQIKWVNDIFYNNKKVCGILTEAITSLETHKLEYVIIGIGINLFIDENELPEDIKDIATSLFNHIPNYELKAKLVSEILNTLWEMEKSPCDNSILQNYKDLSLVLGKNIIIKRNPIQKAKAIDINSKGNLIVEHENGEIEGLHSGEISILLS